MLLSIKSFKIILFNGFIENCMLGSHFYHNNPFSTWQIYSYNIEYLVIHVPAFLVTDDKLSFTICKHALPSVPLVPLVNLLNTLTSWMGNLSSLLYRW